MNIYLITSDSYKLINEEVNKIVTDSLNVIKYDLRIDSLSDAINEAGYFSLLNEKKYIIINAAGLFKTKTKDEKDNNDEQLKIIENYLKFPNENSVLIFTTLDHVDKRKKIFKLVIDNGKYVEIPNLNKKELVYKIMELLRNRGFKTDYETANYIAENSYCNYDIVTNELEKIYTILKPCNLTIDIINQIISKSLNDNVFNFLSCLLNKNIEKANIACKDFEQLKIEPNMVLVLLAKEFQIMYLLKSKISIEEVQKKFNKESWQMQNYLNNIDNFTLDEIKKIIVLLNNYDYKLKMGLLDKSVILDLLILELGE